MKLEYYKELDGIRGLAALMVMVFHFLKEVPTNSFGLLKLVQKLSIFGQTGVTLFFVLSGFLITRILINQKNKENYFKNFYIRRSLRIFPLYYFFIILSFIIIPLFTIGNVISFDKTWTFWVYLQNFAFTFNWSIVGPNHFWSLAVEEHFYLIWPFIVYFTSIKTLKYIIYLICLIALLIRVYLIHLGYGTFYFTFTNMDCLAIGALLAIYQLENKINSKNLLIGASILFVTLLIAWSMTSGLGLDIIQYIKLPLIAIFYMAVIGIVISSKTFLNGIFRNSFLTSTGKISYGLYVYHPLCFWFVHSHFQLNIVADLIVSFTMSYVVASLSYYLFEIYFISLKSKYSS